MKREIKNISIKDSLDKLKKEKESVELRFHHDELGFWNADGSLIYHKYVEEESFNVSNYTAKRILIHLKNLKMINKDLQRDNSYLKAKVKRLETLIVNHLMDPPEPVEDNF